MATIFWALVITVLAVSSGHLVWQIIVKKEKFGPAETIALIGMLVSIISPFLQPIIDLSPPSAPSHVGSYGRTERFDSTGEVAGCRRGVANC
jgi:hypothetical protein